MEGWKLEFVFLIARGADPVIYVFLVQYNWRTGYWSLYLCPWSWIAGEPDTEICIHVSTTG